MANLHSEDAGESLRPPEFIAYENTNTPLHRCNSAQSTSFLPDLSMQSLPHSSSLSMSEHLVNMREVDADILELGVEKKRRADISDFDENGCRSVRSDSISSYPDDENENEGAVACQSGEGVSNKELVEIKSLKHVASMPKIVEDSAASETTDAEDDYLTADIPSTDQDADVLLKHHQGKHARLDSFERRSRESAQFAAAVGENSNLLLNKIIEGDSSSDFDDDDIDEEIKTEEEIKTDAGDSDANKEELAPYPSPISSPVDLVQTLRRSTLSAHPPFRDWKFTRQYSSRYGEEVKEELGYKGISSSRLEITQRGVSRGNYAQLHRKAWLEVSDKHHRYGKNLRMYYSYWESLDHPYSMFFDWLDSKGEAEGQPLPNLPECSRTLLDSDTVLYITDPEVSSTYALEIVADQDGSAIILDRDSKRPVCTGKEGWIFVLRDHVMYGSQKVTAPGGCCTADGASSVRQRFHHSSFFGGKAVASAGIFLTNDQGRLTDLWPHSGHYRPGEAHMQRVLFFLRQHSVELSTFEVDMQQIFKVCRKKSPKDKAKKKEENKTDGDGQNPQEAQPKKAKKTECLLNMAGSEVASFLAHKARFIEKGVFHQIHKIRKLPKEERGSVKAILDLVNE